MFYTQARHAHDAAAALEEHVSAVERNRCEFIPCEGGFMAIRGFFDPVAAATIKTAVLPLARRTGTGDDRSRPRRLADALVEIASHALDLGIVPTSGGASTDLQLTASVETVMGLEGAAGGDLEFAGAVPAATVQRLACHARVRRILLGPNSAVIDVGRALRLPSPVARAALRARSGGCEWPGCDRPVALPTLTIWCTGATAAAPTWTTSSIVNTTPSRAPDQQRGAHRLRVRNLDGRGSKCASSLPSAIRRSEAPRPPCDQ
jgi:hypothetical protein